MSRLLMGGVFAAALACAGGSAQAQALKSWAVTTSPLMILAGPDARIGVERVVQVDDEVLAAKVGFHKVAFIDRAIELRAADHSYVFPAGAALLGATAKGGEAKTFGPAARIFCEDGHTSGKAYAAAQDPVAVKAKGKRLRDTVQFCVVDKDGDGMLESSFLVGTKWAEDRPVVAIKPVHYVERTDEPLPLSRARIVFRKGALLQGPILELEVSVMGRPMNLQAVWLDDGGKDRRFPVQRGIKKKEYPFEIVFGGARVMLKAYEPEGRKLTLQVQHGFDTAQMRPEWVTRVIYIYY